MPALITVLGSCLIAASAAVAADRPADHAADPWWLNSPSAASPASGSNTTGYAAAATDPRSQVTEIPPPGSAGQMAEVAPDPPGLPRSDTLPAAFQQDSPRAAETPAETTHAVDPARQLSATAPVAAVRQAPAPGTHGWPDPAAAVGQAPAPSTHGWPDRVEKSLATSPPAAHPSPPTAPAEPAEPLGLGSHNGKNGSGKRSSLSAMITVGGSLAIVLGLFSIIAWAMRKTAPRGSLLLPKEVFEILGLPRWGPASKCNCCAAATSCCWSRSRPVAPRP